MPGVTESYPLAAEASGTLAKAPGVREGSIARFA